MAKTKKAKSENGQIPIEAVPHLANQRILQWLQTIFKAQKELYNELQEIKKKV